MLSLPYIHCRDIRRVEQSEPLAQKSFQPLRPVLLNLDIYCLIPYIHLGRKLPGNTSLISYLVHYLIINYFPFLILIIPTIWEQFLTFLLEVGNFLVNT